MKRILVIVIAFSALGVSAQQDPQFTQNFGNKLYNNPAYAAMKDGYCATVLGRQQWLGFEGAPRTGLISLQGRIPQTLTSFSEYVDLGVGLSVSNDVIGPVNTNIFKLALANRIYLEDIGTISVGLGLGAIGVVVDGSGFVAPDAPGSVVTDPNLSLEAGSGKDYGFDFDAGLYYRSADEKIWAGAAMQHLTQSELQGEAAGGTGSNNYSVESHLYIMGGYRIQGLVPDWEFEPSIFLKTELSTTQFDFNAKATYKDMIWGGLSYRIQDAFSPMAGYRHDFGKAGTMQIGAAYDLNTSKLRSFNSGTVELFLNYCFTITPKPKITIHKNPRWL